MKNSTKIKPEYAVLFDFFFLNVKHSVKKFQKLYCMGIIIMLFSFNRSTRGFYIDYFLLQHSVLEQKTIPENLPSPTDGYKLKYRQYEADLKEEYRQYSQRIAEKKKDHFQHPEASIKVAGKGVIAFLNSQCMLVFHDDACRGLHVYVINFFHVFIVKK